MRYFLATVAVGLLGVSGFNFYADPSARFLRAMSPIRAGWSGAQCLVLPIDFDERSARDAHIRFIDAPDLVALGSSRAMLVDGGFFPGLKFYNAALSGATVEDYAAMWQALKESNKLPRRLIIFVDPWAFNKNSFQQRWRENVDLTRRFAMSVLGRDAGSYALAAQLLEQSVLQRLRLAELADLLSWSVLKASIARLRRGPLVRADRILEGAVVDISALPYDCHAWRADGSSIDPQGMDKPLAPEEMQRVARTYAWAEDVYSIWHYEFDDGAYRLLEDVLKDASASRVKALLVVPPYEPTVQSILSSRPAYRDVVPATNRALSRLAAGNDSVSFCDSADALASKCEETEFMDAMHMLRPCVAKVLSRCLASSPDWKDVPFSPGETGAAAGTRRPRARESR